MTDSERLVARLAELGKTCGTAESCTGGGVGFAITAVPGASAVFLGGVVSYDNRVKRDVLGVANEVLSMHGAVSPECAEQMAAGARRVLGVDCAVSVTGIAGPGGGSAEKPVGLVWFGFALPSGVATEKRIFAGDRDAVRKAAVEHAIGSLLSRIEGEWP